MSRAEVINALADYFQVKPQKGDYFSGDWVCGCTILGDDGEYRWLTLENVIEALDRAWLLDDDDDDYED